MSGFLPDRKPDITRQEVVELLTSYGVKEKNYPCALVGFRGYYESMGVPDQNDRRIYDDAFAFISPATFATFNGNTDPNGYRYGYGTGAKKGMASLKTGLWYYRTGIHKTYAAFIQADKVTVIRDGQNGDYEDTGWFGINIHRGGSSSTSSLGCQTIPVNQWPTFKSLIYSELTRFNQKIFPYLLINADGTETEVKEYKAGERTLRKGDRGPDVKELQKMLTAQGHEVYIDGDFGTFTEGAVKDFQKAYSLFIDGIVGKNTWSTLKLMNFKTEKPEA